MLGTIVGYCLYFDIANIGAKTNTYYWICLNNYLLSYIGG